MTAYDVEVNLQSLAKAAQGTAESIDLMKDKDVVDFLPSESEVGHETVWSTVDESEGRWERGVNDMSRDIEEVSGRLARILMNYGEFDEEGRKTFEATKTSHPFGQVRGGD